MARVEFFFDFVSPYSYLAQTQIRRICEEHGAELELRPMLLGGVLQATGNHSPREVPAKGRYMLQDLHDWAEHYGVPLRFPDPFPFSSMKSLRAANWCAKGGKLDEFVREAFTAYWAEGLSPKGTDQGAEDGSLTEVARRAELDPTELLEAASSPEMKEALRNTTEEAVERGAFGAPTIFVNEALYWGNDRLHFVEAALADR